MKRWCTCLAVALVLAACGSDNGNGENNDDNNVAMIDLGNPDAGGVNNSTSDGGTIPDAQTPNSGNNSTSETPRDDLDVVMDDREVEFQSGSSGRLAFDVPDDAVSVTISVTGETGQFFSLEEWKNGDGEDIVPNTWIDSDRAAPSICLSCQNRIASSEASFAAIVPNNARTELVPGTHNISVYAYRQAGISSTPLSDATATVRIVVKRLPEEPATGVLDINFHFTGANGWTAETAPEDEDFQKLLDDVQTLYDQVGVEIGVVTYNDIPEEYRIIENTTLPDSDLQEMFALSEGQPRKALNVFIVEELMSGLGPAAGIVAGISGGIPGPPMAGTHRSGVAISTKQDPRFPTETSRVLGHEMGHHLGLFHTTENQFAGGFHDPIEDTPEDDSSLLMFTVPEGDTLTTTQGEVVRRNRWINHGDGQ